MLLFITSLTTFTFWDHEEVRVRWGMYEVIYACRNMRAVGCGGLGASSLFLLLAVVFIPDRVCWFQLPTSFVVDNVLRRHRLSCSCNIFCHGSLP